MLWCEKQVAGTELEGTIPIGSSFKSLFLRKTEHPLVPVVAHEADLQQPYPVPNEIEFLINDAVKTWVAAKIFARKTLGRVIQNGCVVHQDFLWPTEAFLVPMMYHFREYFQGLYIVPGSCMAVFVRTPRESSQETFKTLPIAFRQMDPALVSGSFAWLRNQFQGVDEPIALLCQATLLWKLGRFDESRELIEQNQLGTIDGSSLFQFQRDVLRSWRFKEMFQ